MENSKSGQESRMVITDGKKAEVRTAEGLDLTTETRVRVVQRDLATQWPSSDAGAENIHVFQDHLTALLSEGWKIEEVKLYDRKPIGDMTSEFVIPVFFLLVR